jgi:hypothetical protein
MLGICDTKSILVKQSQIQSVYSSDFATIKINDECNTCLNYNNARDINVIKTGKFEVINELEFNHYGGKISSTYTLKAK